MGQVINRDGGLKKGAYWGHGKEESGMLRD